ncbi:hypothetical protein Lal_00028510 [Lupinus albus]|nr:hypothetical protein Lal_00028510 [Lupinus albus]
MGKEWHWTGKSFKKGTEAETQTQIPSGCMSGFFQFFNFHLFHFHNVNNHQQQITFNSAYCIAEDHTSIPKGAEAPRNSLESEDGTISIPSKEEKVKIPKNIQIKTSGDTRTTSGGNLNLSNSPGIRTLPLVARLMGLDLLPQPPSSLSSTSLPTPNPQGKSFNMGLVEDSPSSVPLITKDQNQNAQQPQLPRVLTKPKPPQQALLPFQQELQKLKWVPKCKKASNEKLNSWIKRPTQTTDIIRNKQEESFIIIGSTSPTSVNDIKQPKCKKTRLLSSNVLGNFNAVSNFLLVKTDPSPPATKNPQKQVPIY